MRMFNLGKFDSVAAIIAAVLLFAGAQQASAQSGPANEQPARTPQFRPLAMGVNVNERPHWLKPGLLQQSRTTWVRAFIEASHYIKGRRELDDDFRTAALKRVADRGYKVLLSIKWNLKEAGWRVPEPGSRQERQWFGFAGRLLEELQGDLSMLVLVNEITIDTPEADLQPNEDGVIPFVRFQQRLLDHISGLNPTAANGHPLPVYTGGFTRLDTKKLQTHPANRAMFKWINEDDRLAGADFHMHQPDYETTVQAADFIRTAIPDKPLIVTEFSLIWKWKAHLGQALGATEKGKAFAGQYHYDPSMSVAEYATRAFSHPVGEGEWHDFMKSQTWFEPRYLDVMGRVMENHGVVVATYAFTQNPDTDEAWTITEQSTPWFIQQLFIPRVAVAKNRTATNYGLFESFVRWQEVTQTIRAAGTKNNGTTSNQ